MKGDRDRGNRLWLSRTGEYSARNACASDTVGGFAPCRWRAVEAAMSCLMA